MYLPIWTIEVKLLHVTAPISSQCIIYSLDIGQRVTSPSWHWNIKQGLFIAISKAYWGAQKIKHCIIDGLQRWMSNAYRKRLARSEKLTCRELGLSYDCCDALGSNADWMSRPLPSVQCGGTKEAFYFLLFEWKIDTIKNTGWRNLKQKEFFWSEYGLFPESVLFKL